MSRPYVLRSSVEIDRSLTLRTGPVAVTRDPAPAQARVVDPEEYAEAIRIPWLGFWRLHPPIADRFMDAGAWQPHTRLATLRMFFKLRVCTPDGERYAAIV